MPLLLLILLVVVVGRTVAISPPGADGENATAGGTNANAIDTATMAMNIILNIAEFMLICFYVSYMRPVKGIA